MIFFVAVLCIIGGIGVRGRGRVRFGRGGVLRSGSLGGGFGRELMIRNRRLGRLSLARGGRRGERG